MNQRKITPYVGSLSIILIFFLLLFFGDNISETVRDSLSVTVSRVIPALFPYMVLSSVTVSADLLRPMYSVIPTERIFALPRESASVFLTGLLCGSPLGASGSCILFENGKISRSEAALLCAVSSFVSPSFLIGCVGALWNCKSYAILLYLSGILVNISVGTAAVRRSVKAQSSRAVMSCTPHAKTSPAAVICRAVSDAAVSCLTVTAFITFFRCAAVLFTSLIPQLGKVLIPVFEFSSGVITGAGIGGMEGAVITGFSIGFSGLSVLMQLSSFTVKHSISLRLTAAVAVIRGIVLAIISAVFFSVHGMTPDSTASVFSHDISQERMIFTFILLAAAIIVCNIVRTSNKFQRKY